MSAVTRRDNADDPGVLGRDRRARHAVARVRRQPVLSDDERAELQRRTSEALAEVRTTLDRVRSIKF